MTIEVIRLLLSNIRLVCFHGPDRNILPIKDIIQSIDGVIKEVKPEIVYLPVIQDNHTDHYVTVQATMSCTKWFKNNSIKKVYLFTIISFVLIGVVVYLMKEWAEFSYRSLNIHLGALFGTIMAFNVWFRIWPAQQRIITAIKNGSGPDENDFEGGFRGKDKATFPYDLKKLGKENGGYGILSSTPYGNSLTADFAIEAIDAEELGKDDITDILAVSFSSTDYVGHNFGVNSKEIEDTYIRLDMDIARLLKALDDKVGKGNYTVFLTADHAAINNPGYLKSKRIPAGSFHMGKVNDTLNSYLTGKYGDLKLIENISNYQVFFDYDVLAENNINRQELQKDIAHFLLQQPNVDKAYTREELTSGEFNYGEISLVQKGFNQKRSGDVFIVIDPGYAGIGKTGSTHGSPESYDTHVPLLFYGKGINNGKHTDRTTTIPDIAATVAALLNIEFPSGEAGEPILEALAD